MATQYPLRGYPIPLTVQDSTTGHQEVVRTLVLQELPVSGATVDLAGGLTPSLTLAADASVFRDLAGDLAPSVTLSSSLSVDATAPPWLPDSVAGLDVWLDAAQLALADGATVAAWPNLGAGADPTMISATPAATFQASAANGHGIVRFSANGARVRGTTSITHNFTLLGITRRWGSTLGRSIGVPIPAANILIGFHAVGMDCCYDAGFLTMGTPWDDTTLPNPWRLYGYDSTPTTNSTRFFVYGEVMGTRDGSEGLANAYSLSGYTSDDTQETMDCDVAELLVYDNRLDDADRQSAEGYIAWKWGVETLLPPDHPYADAPPGGTGGGGMTVELVGDFLV